jgi:RNase H-fold protein (predicted Holliday junction resolvase)
MTDSLHSARLKGERVLIGFDPGRDKCGIAVVQVQALAPMELRVLHREVIPSAAALSRLQTLRQQFQAEQVILGNQTTAQAWKSQLESILPPAADCPGG